MHQQQQEPKQERERDRERERKSDTSTSTYPYGGETVEDENEDENEGYYAEPIERWLEVTDLKQYRYCARVVYYRYHLPRIRPTTYKMEDGILAHQTEAYRETRRKLQLFELADTLTQGEKFLDVRLTDPELGLHGRLDLVIALPNRQDAKEVIPVEYKWSTRPPGTHFRLQLAAYAYLLQREWGISVERGIIYQPPLRRSTTVKISGQLLKQVPATVGQIKTLIRTERLPPPPKQIGQCLNCEFRRICNDTF
jgi:CRISPR-associated exonuclease Cas4